MNGANIIETSTMESQPTQSLDLSYFGVHLVHLCFPSARSLSEITRCLCLKLGVAKWISPLPRLGPVKKRASLPS